MVDALRSLESGIRSLAYGARCFATRFTVVHAQNDSGWRVFVEALVVDWVCCWWTVPRTSTWGGEDDGAAARVEDRALDRGSVERNTVPAGPVVPHIAAVGQCGQGRQQNAAEGHFVCGCSTARNFLIFQ